ncbi:MAG: hypothetical protein MJ237_07810 [bacterium]|nr:hypothetical protein [bacterium]
MIDNVSLASGFSEVLTDDFLKRKMPKLQLEELYRSKTASRIGRYIKTASVPPEVLMYADIWRTIVKLKNGSYISPDELDCVIKIVQYKTCPQNIKDKLLKILPDIENNIHECEKYAEEHIKDLGKDGVTNIKKYSQKLRVLISKIPKGI